MPRRPQHAIGVVAGRQVPLPHPHVPGPDLRRAKRGELVAAEDGKDVAREHLVYLALVMRLRSDRPFSQVVAYSDSVTLPALGAAQPPR